MASSNSLRGGANDNQVFDVVIIGAGWSGLGAAETLLSKGVSNFLVLEASDTIGGRCQNVTLNDGITAELGCQWIHGASTQNPVYNIVKKSGIPTKESDFDDTARYSNVYGGIGPHRVWNVPETDYNSFMSFQARLQDSTNYDQSLRKIADSYIKNKGLKGDARLRFEYLLDTYIVQEYAASLQDLSLWWWDNDEVIGDIEHVIEQGAGKGYTGVLNYYAAPFADRVRYNSLVTSINWSSTSNVVVTYSNYGSTSTVNAKKVIVTVPLGVLQKGSINFTPALPTWKSTAINKLGVGTYNKIILQWNDDDTLPWPNVEWIEKISKLGDQGHWTEFFNMKPTTGKQVLIAFSAGKESERVESLSDAIIQSEVIQSLEEMFGVSTIPTPANVVITRWKANPLSNGSYSYYKVGSKPKHRTDLGAAVGNRVFFAGEACHLDYPSTTHGALMSGQATAAAVANEL